MKNYKKSVITIDIEKKDFIVKSYSELYEYIGGEVVCNYLMSNYLSNNDKVSSYTSFCTGPLSGIFPYTGKCVVSSLDSNLNKTLSVGGGKLGSLLNLSGILAIEIIGKSDTPVVLDISRSQVKFLTPSEAKLSSLGLVGRRATVSFLNGGIQEGNFLLSNNVVSNGLVGFVYSFDGEYKIPDTQSYKDVLSKLSSLEESLSVVRGGNESCFGCPMGCALSTKKESLNPSILTRSLVGCGYADSIYSQINLVFSCFSSLKIDYNHEFLEFFPQKAGLVARELNDKIEKIKLI